MDVYVLKDGRRMGPFLPFKLREMLEDGEISPEDQGWLEGMEAWEPLHAMEPLAGWMPRRPGSPPPLPSAAEWEKTVATLSPKPPQETAGWTLSAWAIQRWVARLTDATLWYALVWLIGVQAGWLNVFTWIPQMGGLLLCLIPPLLWLPVEATLLHWLGTTPGKWFMGIRVTDELGQKLTWLAALKRAALVHVAGNGLGLPVGMFIPVLQWSMAWMFHRRTGTTIWDRGAGAQVEHRGVFPLGVLAVISTAIGWFSVYTHLLLTAPIPANLPEEQREYVQEMRRQLLEVQKQLEARTLLMEQMENNGAENRNEANSPQTPDPAASPSPATPAPEAPKAPDPADPTPAQ